MIEYTAVQSTQWQRNSKRKHARDRQDFLRILLSDYEFVEVFHELVKNELHPSPDTRRGTPVSEWQGPLTARGDRPPALVRRSHMTAPVSGDDVRGVEKNEHVELVGFRTSY